MHLFSRQRSSISGPKTSDFCSLILRSFFCRIIAKIVPVRFPVAFFLPLFLFPPSSSFSHESLALLTKASSYASPTCSLLFPLLRCYYISLISLPFPLARLCVTVPSIISNLPRAFFFSHYEELLLFFCHSFLFVHFSSPRSTRASHPCLIHSAIRLLPLVQGGGCDKNFPG